MEKIIEMPVGGVKKLEKRFGATRETIGNALRFRTDTKLARMIRKVALSELGGAVYEKKE